MKPMWYSYIFIACDVISLAIQAAGGGTAAGALTVYESADNGTHIMVGGLAFQVFTMSIFMCLFLDFLWKIKYMRKGHDDMEFNPKYAHLRERKMFKWFPVVIFIGVILVYIRSIYRVIELAEGWTGYLIVHEVFFMILDALMMALCIVLFVPFHPGVVLGRGTIAIEGSKAYAQERERGIELEKIEPCSASADVGSYA
jgi:hypothetical protein